MEATGKKITTIKEAIIEIMEGITKAIMVVVIIKVVIIKATTKIMEDIKVVDIKEVEVMEDTKEVDIKEEVTIITIKEIKEVDIIEEDIKNIITTIKAEVKVEWVMLDNNSNNSNMREMINSITITRKMKEGISKMCEKINSL